MHKKVILGTALIFIVLVVLVVYSRLGGLDEITFETIGESRYVLYGKSFEGMYSDPDLEQVFFEIKRIREEEFPDGKLAVINYRHEGEQEGKVRQFIGIVLNEDTASVSTSLGKREISFRQGIRAIITSHNLVMPKPEKVHAGAAQRAAAQGWQLAGYSLEIYQSDRRLSVEFPVE